MYRGTTFIQIIYDSEHNPSYSLPFLSSVTLRRVLIQGFNKNSSLPYIKRSSAFRVCVW